MTPPRGYKALMEKIRRDRDGEIFQDDLTENQSKPRGPRREEDEETLNLDPDVDSQEADEALAKGRFSDPEQSDKPKGSPELVEGDKHGT